MTGGGDVGKEGITYEEKVLAFILSAPFEIGAAHFIHLENTREWEINPKLFNSEILQIPFSIDVDFFIKKGSVYHIFFSKSSNKLSKKPPKSYLEKALATFCVLESRGRAKFKENFAYYYISDMVAWEKVEKLRNISAQELSPLLMKAVGCQDLKEVSQMFSASVIERVKQKTVFCQIVEETITERNQRFGTKFNDILSEVVMAAREVEQAVHGNFPQDITSHISIGDTRSELGKKYTIEDTTFWIGNFDQILNEAKRFTESNENFFVIDKLIEKKDFYFDGQTESEALNNISELFNKVIFPERGLEISIIITPNNYDGVLFRDHAVSLLIREQLNYQTGKYDLAKVPFLNKLDNKTAISIAIIAFSKGRSIELKENRFVFE